MNYQGGRNEKDRPHHSLVSQLKSNTKWNLPFYYVLNCRGNRGFRALGRYAPACSETPA